MTLNNATNFTTIATDSGSAVMATGTHTAFTIAGSGNVSTSASGSTITVAGSGGSGEVVQQVRTSKTTAQTITTNIAGITTQPTSSNGESVLSLSITPTSASNILLIEGNVVCVPAGALSSQTAYLIEGGTGNGFGAAWESVATGDVATIPVRYYRVAGGTSSITFDLYASVNGSSNLYINSNTSGTPLSGGSAFTSLMITELTP